MIEPVQELQHLRKTALQVNAACKRWSAAAGRDAEIFSRCALVGWRLARVIAGWLQSHPNWRLHPSERSLDELATRVRAVGESLLYFSDNSRLHWLGSKLDYLERRSADVRAVTSSAAINDMLSRHQPDLKSLRRALHTLRARPNAATPPLTADGVRTQPSAGTRIFARPADGDWPFLTF